jgi:hypothetical protein
VQLTAPAVRHQRAAHSPVVHYVVMQASDIDTRYRRTAREGQATVQAPVHARLHLMLMRTARGSARAMHTHTCSQMRLGRMSMRASAQASVAKAWPVKLANLTWQGLEVSSYLQDLGLRFQGLESWVYNRRVRNKGRV